MRVAISNPPGARAPAGVVRLDYESDLDGRPDWALARPGPDRARWIVMVHGHGSRGDQLYVRDDIRRAWLPAFEAAGAGVLTPNLRGDAWMCPAAVRDLAALLDFVRGEWGAKQFVFFSGSMGGTSNLIYAALRPDDAAGVAALGAATDLADYHRWLRTGDRPIHRAIADAIESAYGAAPADAPELYRAHSPLYAADRLSMPVFLAHGEADETMPVEQARRLADAMKGKDGFAYEEIPGGAHDAPLWQHEAALRWIWARL